LIRQARQGDATAWEMLVRQHQEAAFRLGYLLLRTPAEAEDVAQEAFVRAFLALDKFDETRPFRPWLLQITRNVAKNRLRSLSRYWAMVKRWWWEADTAVTATSVSQGESAPAVAGGAAAAPQSAGSDLSALLFRTVGGGNGRSAGHPGRHGEIAPAPGAAAVEGCD
jgi:DNA-directed RNA polymerase specialized sigma24 family protein